MDEELIGGKRASRKGIWGWMAFDWATQPFHTLILTFIFAPYFTGSVATDPVTGQAQWGYAAAVAGIAIALLSPVLGAVADATGPRKPWILVLSILAVIGSVMLWWAYPGGDSTAVWMALIGFVIAMLGFEFAAVFNNAMMPTLVPRAELGRLSGTAWGIGYIAGHLTLLIVLLFMATNSEGRTLIGIEPLFGLDPQAREGERMTGPLTAIWFAVFVLPMFLFTPDVPRKVRVAGAVRKGISELSATIRRLPANRSLFAFLGSSMFYRDALNGLYTFGGIYAVGVLGWSIVQIGVFGILANITGIFGAILGGRLDQRYGPKFVVTISVVLLMLASLTAITTGKNEILFMSLSGDGISNLPDIVFYICGALIGAAGGSLQAASRTLMVDQAEPGRMTEGFGLYALSGKATSFLAPALIALFTDISGSQRIGVMPIVGLFLIALLLLPLVKEARRETARP